MRNLEIIILSLIIFTLISTNINAFEEPSKYEKNIVNITVKGFVTLSKPSSLIVNVTLFPLVDERQELVSFNLYLFGNKNVEQQKDVVIYTEDSIKEMTFGWNALMQTSLYMPKIPHIPFPIYIEGYSDYKKATEHIDINEEVTKKANELAAGKTDLFEVLHEIADFVYTNMNYNKNYTDSVQKASWVMENKQGVCDEYSVLFIALVRALGIPARYVSGIAYSNIENDFANHAWAEVYMGSEWVPFDTTFGQFGWLDASHVALSKTIDAETSSVTYVYKSDTELWAKELEINATVIDSQKELKGRPEVLDFMIKPLVRETASESYLPLQIEIKNLQNYYLPLEIYLRKSTEIIGKNVKHILASPLSSSTGFFILKIPVAEKNYVYKAEIEARTQFEDAAFTSIQFSQDYESISREKAESIISMMEKSEKQYFYDATLNCYASKEYYVGEPIQIICTIENNANSMLKNLDLCIREQCKIFDLPINSETEQQFIFSGNETEYIATLQHENFSRLVYLSAKILEAPDLEILDFEPKILDYGEQKIKLNLKTKSICNNLLVTINNLRFDIEKINGDETYELDFAGKNALNKKVKVKARCYDLRNRLYEDEKVFEINVINLPWYAKIFQFILQLFD